MENKEKTTTPEMPDIDVLFELADLFKVFGDSTRLRIMYTISENEMSVLNIAEALNMEQSTISHQLRAYRLKGFTHSLCQLCKQLWTRRTGAIPESSFIFRKSSYRRTQSERLLPI